MQNVFDWSPGSRGMLLTVSGPPGSGKSTTAAALADRLGLEHTSGGDIFRELADERGHSLSEFNAMAETDPQIDKDLDQRLYELARDGDDLVLESRLAGWLAGDAAMMRVWLDAPIDVRAERIADREEKPVEQARRETIDREASECQRYRDYYDIHIDDLSIYDVTLNTARWAPETVTDLLYEAVDHHQPASDEGQVEITDVRYEF